MVTAVVLKGCRRIGAWLAAWHAELAVSVAAVLGWTCVARTVALLTTPKVYSLFAGIFLLSCCGWRFLWTVMTKGLYALTRERR